MASTSKSERIYHVFLSFRGEDIRNNFISHLYTALDQKGIYTYVDSEKLRKGEQIAPALMNAIEESHIAIIVFSENYASSWWCLVEVAKIMKCKEERDLMVFPIFYKVEPKEVRTPREKYKEAMVKHEAKFEENSEEVKRWKKALTDAASLSRWHLNDGKSKLIQQIVKEISTHLDRTPLHVAKHPVGIESRVVKLKAMLNLEFDDVVMVGLWGQGGIGKTTLAKALYNSMFRQFEGSCFLANVRETSKGCRGMVTLQEILLKDILLLKKRLEVSNVDGGINLIQHRLCRKIVLLVLDDVDDLQKLHALAGECNWFGNGSRVIITTRNKHLLTCHGIDQHHVYEVEALVNNEAHELLINHASPTHKKLEIRTDLVDCVLSHVEGLPLAIVVLGSFLCGRREHAWKSTLKTLSTIPNKTINDVLQISYEGLPESEKEIFLHIACFFKGWDIEYVKKVFDSCNFETAIGLEILIERSLISMEYDDFEEILRLQVHNLIQLMGMGIAKWPVDPRRRRRLWLYDDILGVLSCDRGDCDVEAIVLEPLKHKEICINANAFARMSRLRLLIVRNVHNSFQGLICFPNELRWFEWPGCAPWTPEFPFGPKELVGLNMSKGNITRVVEQFKYINFSGCELLVCMPDFSCTPNLWQLDLQCCKRLVEAHDSIASHEKLQVLNLNGCPKLSIFPNELKSKNLRTLNLDGCTKFEKFPNIPNKLKDLEKLSLQGTAIKELPTSIENLVSLERMLLDNCKNLEIDPCMNTGLPNLSWLFLGGCNLSEVEFLENLSCFPSLVELYLRGNNITSLPASIKKRDHLHGLDIRNCHQLQEITELPPFLRRLSADNLESLQKNEDLTLIHYFVRRGLTMARMSSIDQVRLSLSLSY
ncbi:hypothetical protein BT93_E1808 [Corymbia citriodora subsp. variegata]|nr:hypothetical protein BT93_E1808 [Corymbia citriodora subsp. variegata]